MKTAFVHDWLTGMRGGEKVLEAACELFPQAEIHTLIHKPDQISDFLNQRRVRASWLNSLPSVDQYYRYLLPLMPLAIRSFDLGDYDLVLSFSHCVAKGARIPIRSGMRPLHICYCHTPMRYMYDQFEDYFSYESRPWLNLAAGWLRPYLMQWDKETSQDVDFFIANSENVRRRIQRIYDRDAEVIYPPIDTDFFTPPAAATRASIPPYYLIAGALVPYKRVDLAIAGCRRLGVPLKIVGRGSEDSRLKKLAQGASVEFLDWQSAETLRELYRNCAALLFPQEEDFGIAAVEALACGRPVIAFNKGGAQETVEEGINGTFFDDQTPESLADAITRFQRMRFDPAVIRGRALRFGRERFKLQFSRFVQDACARRARDHGGLGAVKPRPPVVKKLRVMQVIECGGPGGTGNQVAAVCNSLDPEFFDSTLVYAVRPGYDPSKYRDLASGAKTAYMVPEMVREISLWNDMRAFCRLVRIFRKETPDIVHAHSSKAGVLARLAAWLCRVPKIYYSPHGYSFLQTDRTTATRLYYRFIEWSVSWIGEIVALTPSEAAQALPLSWGKPIHIIPDACLLDQNLKPPVRAEPEEITLGCCGRITAARNPKAFLRLCQKLLGAREDLRCVWIGGGEQEDAVKKSLKNMGLASRVEVSGWLEPPQAQKRLAELDILVHYSSWDGLGSVMLEAMALELPVVAADIPGCRDVVVHGVTGYLAKNETQLLEYCLKLAADAELRRRMGRAGRERIGREFASTKVIGLLQDLYLR